MKAVQINSYGGNDVLEINENAPKPSPAKSQVLAEVYATSINPIDWKVRAGYLKEMVPLQFPATLGGDFAGVICEVGEGVGNFKVGDEVYGQGGILNGGSGSFAEFVAANVGKVAVKPKSADFIEAGALPLAGVSALQALEDHIHLAKGQKILIHGGAGGIGHFAVQLAKSQGAYVATTVSTRDMEFTKSLGADEVIDYESEAFDEKLTDFDAVFDTVGGETTDKSFKVLKKGGIIVSMVGQPNEELAQKYGVSALGQNTDANPERLARLSKLVEDGKIKVYIDKVFPPEQAKEAFGHLEEGRHQGKVVLKIR
mgnify:FL=1